MSKHIIKTISSIALGLSLLYGIEKNKEPSKPNTSIIMAKTVAKRPPQEHVSYGPPLDGGANYEIPESNLPPIANLERLNEPTSRPTSRPSIDKIVRQVWAAKKIMRHSVYVVMDDSYLQLCKEIRQKKESAKTWKKMHLEIENFLPYITSYLSNKEYCGVLTQIILNKGTKLYFNDKRVLAKSKMPHSFEITQITVGNLGLTYNNTKGYNASKVLDKLPNKADFNMFITTKMMYSNQHGEVLGLAYMPGNDTAIKFVREHFKWSYSLTSHELGHNFGLPDNKNPRSIMLNQGFPPEDNLDISQTEIQGIVKYVKKHKNRIKKIE